MERMGKSMIPPKIEDMIVLCKQGYQDAFRSAAIIAYFLYYDDNFLMFHNPDDYFIIIDVSQL
jgi:hypothetical protein